MDRESPIDPAAHQPAKSDMEKDVIIDATPEALAWAVTRGGAERRAIKEQKMAVTEGGRNYG